MHSDSSIQYMVRVLSEAAGRSLSGERGRRTSMGICISLVFISIFLTITEKSYINIRFITKVVGTFVPALGTFIIYITSLKDNINKNNFFLIYQRNNMFENNMLLTRNNMSLKHSNFYIIVR